MHVITLRFDEKNYTEIHMLNPRETLVPFGGSKSGLLVGKTASLVTRSVTPYGLHDTEHDINDPRVWSWIADIVNRKIDDVKAELPGKD